MVLLNTLSPEKTEKAIECLKGYLKPERISVLGSVLEKRTIHFAVGVDNIYQPHNAAAILRSCDAFGIDTIIINESHNPFLPNSRVAMGAEKWTTVYKHNFIAEEIDWRILRQYGYKIAAATPHPPSVSVFELPIDQPLALVFGTERKGLPDDLPTYADYNFTIPMYGFTESFNVSVSVALTLQALRHRLDSLPTPPQMPHSHKQRIWLRWLLQNVRASRNILLKEEILTQEEINSLPFYF